VTTESSATTGTGVEGFVSRHGLHTPEQLAAAERVAEQIEVQGLRTVRIVLVDQHGLPRTKWLSARAFSSALRGGADFSGAIYSLDTSNAVFTQAFAPAGGFGIEEFTGFPDVIAVPDPTTFRVLPWADRTGWVICDPYFSSGAPVPLDGRRLLRDQVAAAGELGCSYLSGLEVEFYVVARESATIALTDTGMPAKAPRVTAVEGGYQFLSEYRQSTLDATLTVLRDALHEVGLPPRSVEKEWGPGQIEITFEPMAGLASADAMVLFRAAAKAVCHSRGLLASFMSWPALPNFFPSGWHLHESLVGEDGSNAFASPDAVLSPTGTSYAAGILEHARAMTVLTTPTINGMRRFRPYSFAPDRVCWGLENRGTMLRVQGAPGDPGSHLENRLGEPAANPYVYLAGSLAAGLDGVRRSLTPPPMVDRDPYTVDAPTVPTSMEEAVGELEGSSLYRGAFGDGFVDYFAMMKRAELARFTEAVGKNGGDGGDSEGVTSWEMDEYFETF